MLIFQLFFLIQNSFAAELIKENTTLKNISFKNTLILQYENYIVDAGKQEKLICPEKRKSVATINLTKTTIAEISCAKEYPGNVQIEYASVGEKKNLIIAGAIGDGGDQGETRSLISRDSEENLILQTTSVNSSQEADTENSSTTCYEVRNSFIWSDKTKDFKTYKPSKEFLGKEFNGDIYIDSNCLKDKKFKSNSKDIVRY